MNNDKQKAIIMARVSSKEQEETGYSLPAQEKLLNNYADNKNFTVVKVFSLSESASGAKRRKIFEEMLNYLKANKINNLLCEKVDRLTRNMKDAVKVNGWVDSSEENKIHFVKQNLIIHKNAKSDEKFRWDIEIVLAKKYISNLSEEVKKGQKEKIAQGWIPTTPPIGYKTIGEKGHKIHIIDETKAPLVRKMFELYGSGNYSLEKLTEVLAKDGLKNKPGRKVSKTQIHAQFSNPFYIGKIVWNNKEYQGKHKPLVSIDLWNKVQNVLHKKGAPKYSKHNFIFRSLFRCSECGGVIAWETKKGFWYGHCNHYRPCSQIEYYRYEKIQEQLIEKVKLITPKSPKLTDWVIKALKENHSEEIAYHNSFTDELNKVIATAKNRLDKIYDDKIDDKITEVKYNELRARYENEEQEALEALKKHANANAKYYDYGLLVLDITKNALAILQDKKKPDEIKREYYKTIFSELKITGNEVKTEFNMAFKILADFNSKMKKLSNTKENILELPINCLLNEKTGAFAPARSALLPGSDSNRRPTR